MTTERVWLTDEIVEQMAGALYASHRLSRREQARAALTAVADALEGAILAPVSAAVDAWAHDRDEDASLYEHVAPILADPAAAIAKHNAAIAAKALRNAARQYEAGLRIDTIPKWLDDLAHDTEGESHE
jgi:hypothetical protein